MTEGRRTASYSIGEMGALTGTKTPTIRYYEQIGLLAAAERTEGNQRRYDDAARQRLAFVRHARDLGFTLDAIRDLLSLSDHPEQSCASADAIAREQLAAVDGRIANLTRLRDELTRMIAMCAGGSVDECRVIQTLGDHGLCLYDTHDAGGPPSTSDGRAAERRRV